MTTQFTSRRWMKRAEWGLIHVILLVIGFFYVYPFLWMVGSSLKTSGGFFTDGLRILPSGEWQWNNFIQAWYGAKFSRYFFNTIFVTTQATAYSILIASMTGYALARLYIPGKKYLVACLAMIFFLPRGFTILPIFDIIRRLRLLNTLWSIILVSTAGGLLWYTFFFFGYIRAIPSELEEAAIIDGASVAQRFFRIILPLSTPMIVTQGIFAFIGNWNNFLIPLVFTMGKPELRTLAVGMYAFVGANSREWTLMCAAASISLLPIIGLFVFVQRYFIEGLAGALKG